MAGLRAEDEVPVEIGDGLGAVAHLDEARRHPPPGRHVLDSQSAVNGLLVREVNLLLILDWHVDVAVIGKDHGLCNVSPLAGSLWLLAQTLTEIVGNIVRQVTRRISHVIHIGDQTVSFAVLLLFGGDDVEGIDPAIRAEPEAKTFRGIRLLLRGRPPADRLPLLVWRLSHGLSVRGEDLPKIRELPAEAGLDHLLRMEASLDHLLDEMERIKLRVPSWPGAVRSDGALGDYVPAQVVDKGCVHLVASRVGHLYLNHSSQREIQAAGIPDANVPVDDLAAMPLRLSGEHGSPGLAREFREKLIEAASLPLESEQDVLPELLDDTYQRRSRPACELLPETLSQDEPGRA